ncbi:MAG: HlyD family efflux transporter periplasmic adaptor subunit [Saprospiraceae bacterium]|nr:HlyD family efflux transporter periplasmic adaptor subunit [Saprospiraceae bacterium]MCB9323649.1 HlyD family efflux transporter periplasmic adaptor subunit [Lewinellaceae bacterium]
MKKSIIQIFLISLLCLSCHHNKKGDAASGEEEFFASRAQVIAGNPALHLMKEELTMNAVTIYTSRENIRATTTGFVQAAKIQQGNRVKAGEHVFSIKTKEAEALGDEILKDPDINITGVIHINAKNTGIITQVFFQEGDYVAEGDVMAEVTKPNSLAVKLYVPYEYNQEVTLQKRVSVRLPDGEWLKGVVKQLLPSEDVVSQTMPYLVTLTPFRFLPENLNLTVSVPLHLKDNALAVPRKAVQSNEEQTDFWVMKILNDTLAIRQTVFLGLQSDSLIELKNSPLTPEDRIVIDGAYGLPDTASIMVVPQL